MGAVGFEAFPTSLKPSICLGSQQGSHGHELLPLGYLCSLTYNPPECQQQRIARDRAAGSVPALLRQTERLAQFQNSLIAGGRQSRSSA